MFHAVMPVDSDPERARAAANAILSFAEITEGLRVTILNVEPEIDVTGGEGGKVDSENWFDPEEVPQSMTVARGLLEEAGANVDTRREHAEPAEAILDVARELDADLIVMAARKRTPVGKALFGSVTQSVLLNADRPVTVTFTE
jgi:nucleotide-binding universal stress UspA family protein